MIDDIKNETIALFTKAWVWILSTVFGMLVGIIGKISYEILQGKKITFLSVVATFGAGLFSGVVASLSCVYLKWEEGSYIVVPIASMLGKEIMTVLVNMDWKDTWKEILIRMAPKKPD